ncbi:hypothetical protein CJ430_31510, partial [Klebsiella pneumoniae]
DGCASAGGLGGTYAGNPLAVARARGAGCDCRKSSCVSALMDAPALAGWAEPMPVTRWRWRAHAVLDVIAVR